MLKYNCPFYICEKVCGIDTAGMCLLFLADPIQLTR